MLELLYAKMLKETETEETIVFFCGIFNIGSISIGGGGGPGPPGYAYALEACLVEKVNFETKPYTDSAL